jgi:hypothetical protein
MIYLTAEIILVNLLNSKKINQYIGIVDVGDYCKRIKRNLAKVNIKDEKYVHFDINYYSLINVLEKYNDKFFIMNDEFCKIRDFNINYFNTKYPKEIINVLTSSLK